MSQATEGDCSRPGRVSGGDKLLGLMSMIKRDRAEKHMKAGMKAADGKDWREAVEEFCRASDLFKEMKDDAREASAHESLALCHFALGNLSKAEKESRKAFKLMRKALDPEGEATALLGLANVLLAKGDLDDAEMYYEKAFASFRTLGVWDGVMRSHLGLERVAISRGDVEKAEKARENAERARRQLVNSV